MTREDAEQLAEGRGQIPVLANVRGEPYWLLVDRLPCRLDELAASLKSDDYERWLGNEFEVWDAAGCQLFWDASGDWDARGPIHFRLRETVDERVRKLEAEVSRLKAGDLTPDEFNALCHNLHERGCPLTPTEHEAACLKFRRELYGDRCPAAPKYVYVVQRITKTGNALAGVYDNLEQAKRHRGDGAPIQVQCLELRSEAPPSWAQLLQQERKRIATAQVATDIQREMAEGVFRGLTNAEIRDCGATLTDAELDALRDQVFPKGSS